MSYKIGEFSKMVGMEPSKVRYYEKKGVYRKERHENGYRIFGEMDAYHLNNFRTLCARGYSIKEAIETLDGVSVNKVIDTLLEKRNRLDMELLLLQERKKYVEETVSLLQAVKDNPTKVWNEMVPVYMIQPASEKGDYSFAQKNAEERIKWQELIPFTKYIGFGETKAFVNNEDQFVDNGYAVKEEHYQQFQYPEDGTLRQFNMGECICFFARLNEKESVNIKEYPHVLDYVERNGYKLKDNFLCFYFMIPIDELGEDAGVICMPVE